jgi:hypothetical protein
MRTSTANVITSGSKTVFEIRYGVITLLLCVRAKQYLCVNGMEVEGASLTG